MTFFPVLSRFPNPCAVFERALVFKVEAFANGAMDLVRDRKDLRRLDSLEGMPSRIKFDGATI
jgi:hypothetical protein